MATLFTLPQHLRDAIAALADARIVDSGLQAKLDRVLEDADRVEFEDEVELAAEREIVRGANEGSVNGGGRASSKDGEKDKGKEKDEQESTTETETETYPPVPVLRPATIDADILDEIAVWAGRNSERLGAAGLGTSLASSKLTTDAAAYGHIALLAGTTVYLPPRARALAKVAERNSDTVRPPMCILALALTVAKPVSTATHEPAPAVHRQRVPLRAPDALDGAQRPVLDLWRGRRGICRC